MAEVLLGADGRGYDLAKRLDDVGAWQAWLGDAVYAVFSPYLASLSAWEAFMSSAATQTTATVPGTLPSTKSTPMSQIRLQLRVRALLFDKAAGALFVRSSPASSPTVASLNSTYLQLHGGDIYYTYEPETRDGAPHNGFSATTAPIQSKTQSQKIRDVSSSKVNGSCFGRKTSAMVFGNALDRENVNQKDEDDLLQELWYDQFIERNNMNRYLKFPFADYEALKRSPEGMASYMKYLSVHKRRRVMFKDEQSMDVTSSGGDNGSSRYPGMAEDETFLVPEMMFPLNGVPDGIFLPTKKQEDLRKVDLYAPLDSLPHLVTPSQAMIERFGIRPEYLRVEFSRNKCRGKGGLDGNAKLLTEEQALQKAQRTVASVLTTTGLEGGSEVAIGILSEFLGNHISKLGRTLKILTDNYRTRFTSTDLIKMFLETTGFGNVAALSDYMKHNSRNSTQHGPQLHSLRIQQPTHLLSSQTHMRPTLSQMNALGGQNMTFQQQQIQLRQQQIKLLQQQQQQQPQMHVSSLQQQQMQILVRKQQQQQHMHLQGQQQQQMVMQGQQTQQMQMPGRQQQSQQIQIPGQQPQQVQTPGQQQQPQQIQTQGQQQSQQMQIQGQQQQPTQAQLQGQQQTEQMQIQGQQQPQLVQMPGQRQPSQQMQMQALQQQQLQLQIRQQQQQKMQIPPQIHIQQQQQQQKIQQQQQQIQMQQHQNQQIQIKQQHQHPQQSSQIPQQQQIQAQQQNPVQQVQQQQQMQQMLQMRHRQIAAARGSGVALEKDRTMPEVKVENTTDPTMMEASFGNNVSRQQLQFRHQQSAVVSNQQQSGKQFNQYTSVQSPQLQSQGSYGARPQPVKVEGFQELFGGDSSSRQDSEERKLTSP